MTRPASTVIVWFLAAGFLGALMALPTNADAQRPAPGARGASTPARTPPPAVRSRTTNVRHPVVRTPSRPVYRSARVIVGAPIVATPWFYDPYPYPYSYPNPYYHGYGAYAYPPVPYAYEEPMVYVERTPPPESAPVAEPYWYYCQDSKTYYPHVQTCATPWQRVIPHAPQ